MAAGFITSKRCFAALLISSTLYFFLSNEADNDLFGHLMFGRLIIREGGVPQADPFSYTASAFPWLNHEWLAQAVFAALWELGGNPLLLLFKAAIGCLTFLLVFSVMRKRAAGAGLAPYFLGVLLIAVLARGFPIRPQIFTYLGLAFVFFFIEEFANGRRRLLWSLPPVFLLWANLHAGFIAGLGTLFLWTLLSRFSREKYVLFAACTAATVVNPLGPYIYQFILNELGAPHPITEWQPVSLSFEHGAFLFTAALTLLTAVFNRQFKARPWEALLLLITCAAAFKHQRHTPLFAVAAAGPLAHQLAGLWKNLCERGIEHNISRFSTAAISAAALTLCVFQFSLLFAQLQRDGLQIVYDVRDYPARIVKPVLDSSPQEFKIAVPLEWGEYLIWQLYPQAKVSIDGRFAALYPAHIVHDHFDLFYGDSAESPLLKNNPPDLIAAPAGSACVPCRAPGWKAVFHDGIVTIYAQEESAAAKIFPTMPARLPPLPPRVILESGMGYGELQTLRIR